MTYDEFLDRYDDLFNDHEFNVFCQWLRSDMKEDPECMYSGNLYDLWMAYLYGKSKQEPPPPPAVE